MKEAEGRIVALLLLLIAVTLVARSGIIGSRSDHTVKERITLSVPADREVSRTLEQGVQHVAATVSAIDEVEPMAALSEPITDDASRPYNGMLVLYVGLVAVLSLGYHKYTYALKNYPQFPRPKTRNSEDN